MYFIAGGEVDIDLNRKHIRLGVNQFFGEIAVRRRARRSATVTAITRTNLLLLNASDFHALMEQSRRSLRVFGSSRPTLSVERDCRNCQTSMTPRQSRGLSPGY